MTLSALLKVLVSIRRHDLVSFDRAALQQLMSAALRVCELVSDELDDRDADAKEV